MLDILGASLAPTKALGMGVRSTLSPEPTYLQKITKHQEKQCALFCYAQQRECASTFNFCPHELQILVPDDQRLHLFVLTHYSKKSNHWMSINEFQKLRQWSRSSHKYTPQLLQSRPPLMLYSELESQQSHWAMHWRSHSLHVRTCFLNLIAPMIQEKNHCRETESWKDWFSSQTKKILKN